ncbi:hypothetical protein, partial [Variovorax sp. YR266]|uniref:hypothetical protein n=1 Tax=Variovorax sp. YR266 TaxID=1884386 RepID=UPI001C40B2D9
SGSSCTPSRRAWTTDPAHQPSAKKEGAETTLTKSLNTGFSVVMMFLGKRLPTSAMPERYQ